MLPSLEWVSALCLVLLKAYRGHHCKGKQNKNSEEKIVGTGNRVKLIITTKLQKCLVIF
jgi:hypothetical protein